MVDLVKEYGPRAAAEGALRVSLIPPHLSGVPGVGATAIPGGCPSDDEMTVTWCEAFASTQAYLAHKEGTHVAALFEKVKQELGDGGEVVLLEFPGSNHFAKTKFVVPGEVTAVEFPVAAAPDKVLDFLATPQSWVKLQNFSEATTIATNVDGVANDFKMLQPGPDGVVRDILWFTQVRKGADCFSYRIACTRAADGEAGRARPFFAVSHAFTVTPGADAAASCRVRRVVTDFEQHEKLELSLVDMLTGGMIAKENAALASAFAADI